VGKQGKMSNARLTGNVGCHPNPKTFAITTTLLPINRVINLCGPMDVATTQERWTTFHTHATTTNQYLHLPSSHCRIRVQVLWNNSTHLKATELH